MSLHRGFRYTSVAGAVAGLIVCALAACGSPAARPAPTASASPPAAAAGFAGYKWTVTAIARDGKTTPVPATYPVYLEFTPKGQFGASEPVNFHGGTYTVSPGGFTTSDLYSTLVGYAGKDPVTLLAVDAISAFGKGVTARTKVSGDTLTVTVKGYTLTARRDGAEANWPAPKAT